MYNKALMYGHITKRLHIIYKEIVIRISITVSYGLQLFLINLLKYDTRITLRNRLNSIIKIPLFKKQYE